MLAFLPVAAAADFRWDPETELPLTVAVAGTWIALSAEAEPGLAASGQVAHPTGLDALAPSRSNPAADHASNVVAVGSLGLGLAATLLDGVHDRDAPLVRVA